MVPVLKHDIYGDRVRMFEEPVVRAPRGYGLTPGQHGQSGGGMEGEREQIENHEDCGECFLIVPEVVFEVVAAGL